MPLSKANNLRDTTLGPDGKAGSLESEIARLSFLSFIMGSFLVNTLSFVPAFLRFRQTIELYGILNLIAVQEGLSNYSRFINLWIGLSSENLIAAWDWIV
jgi:hypothetical protein